APPGGGGARHNKGGQPPPPADQPLRVLISPKRAHAAAQRNAALSAIWDGGSLEVHGGRIPISAGEPIPHIRPLSGFRILDRLAVRGTADLHNLVRAQ